MIAQVVRDYIRHQEAEDRRVEYLYEADADIQPGSPGSFQAAAVVFSGDRCRWAGHHVSLLRYRFKGITRVISLFGGELLYMLLLLDARKRPAATVPIACTQTASPTKSLSLALSSASAICRQGLKHGIMIVLMRAAVVKPIIKDCLYNHTK